MTSRDAIDSGQMSRISVDEMMEKLRYYLKHDRLRSKIAAAGRARLIRDGHEAADRVRQILRSLPAVPAAA